MLILVLAGIKLSSNLSFLKLKALLRGELYFDVLKIFLTDHYVRIRDFVDWKYTDDHYVSNQEITSKKPDKPRPGYGFLHVLHT
jgi:hypothetical protein